MASEEESSTASLPLSSNDLTKSPLNQSKIDIHNQEDDITGEVSIVPKSLQSTSTHPDDNGCDKQPGLVAGLEGLTKNQLRKLKKRQMWEKKKEQRLELRREKRQERKRKKQNQGAEGAEQEAQRSEVIPRKRRKKMNDPDASDVRVVIDCGFDELMQEGDVTKLSKQIQRSYASNRTSDKPFQFYICNFVDKTKARFQRALSEYPKWDVNFREQGLNELFGKDSIVYLTSESPQVLKDLDPGKVYVIGGLVDHNHHKGVCYQRAVSEGWGHAQLPITDHMKFSGRKVLTVNHVFEILVAYMETQDWKAALDRVIPQRKFHTMSRRERRRLAHRKGAERHCGNQNDSEGSDEPEGHDGSKDEGSSSDGQEAERDSGSKNVAILHREHGMDDHDGCKDENLLGEDEVNCERKQQDESEQVTEGGDSEKATLENMIADNLL